MKSRILIELILAFTFGSMFPNISVVVKDESGERKEGVRVSIYTIEDIDAPEGKRLGRLIYEGSTDASGSLKLRLPDGFYTFHLSENGRFFSYIEGIAVREGKSYRIVLREGEKILLEDFLKVAFSTNVMNPERRCIRMDPEGCDIGILDFGEGDIEWIAKSRDGERFPAFSPSGEEIAYCLSYPSLRRSFIRIHLPSGKTIDAGDGYFPEWDYKGERLFFHRKIFRRIDEIYSLKLYDDAITTPKRLLTSQKDWIPRSDPSPSPKGDMVVFHRKRRGETAHLSILINGKEYQITGHPDHMGHATFSPSGKRIMMSGGRNEKGCPLTIFETEITKIRKSCEELSQVVDKKRFEEWWRDLGFRCRNGDRLHLGIPAYCSSEGIILFSAFCSKRLGRRKKIDYNARLILYFRKGGDERFVDLGRRVEERIAQELLGRGDFFSGDCYNPIYEAWYQKKNYGRILDVKLPFEEL